MLYKLDRRVITAKRIEKGLSVNGLAYEAGVNRDTVYRILRNENYAVMESTLFKLAKWLDCKPNEIAQPADRG